MTTTTQPILTQYIPVQQRYTLQQIKTMPVVIIAAKGRSGTTLLQSIMDAHPNMVVPPESKFVLYLGRFARNRKFVKKDAARITGLLKYERKINHLWRIDLKTLQQDLEWTIEQGATFAEICKVIYLSYPAAVHKTDVMLVGDKNPLYSLYLPYLHSIFSDLRVIHLVREYHDCIASNHVTFKQKSIGKISSSWQHLNTRIEEYSSANPQKSIQLIYEELCKNPEAELNRLFDFLHVAHDTNVLKFNERIMANKGFVKWDALKRTHPGLLEPINTKGIGKYKKYVTPKQIRIMEIVCGKFAAKYGHEYTLPPEERRAAMPLRKFFWKLRFRSAKLVTWTYYRSPYFLRKMSHNFYAWLYKKTGITTQFNASELKLTEEA